MRADSHYVDLISAGGRTDRARADGRAEVKVEGKNAAHRDPEAAPLARAPRDRRIFDHLIEEITAIESAAALLAGDSSPLTRRVSLDLIKAQAARAAWLGIISISDC